MISFRANSQLPTLATMVWAIVYVLTFGAVAFAGNNTNGVSANTISRPSGPGSLEGLGSSFQPALNSGTAQYNVSIVVPPGVAGLTPTLTLRYDGGNGFGVAGNGWKFGPSCIRRQVEKGLPRYGNAPDGESIPDRFLGMEGEELVPLQNGFYLAKVEKLFIRYRFVGNHWEAHTRSGTKLEFGLTTDARVSSIDGSQVFAWCLQRQTDTHGNVIEYEYEQPIPNDRQIYLKEIRYGPGSPPWSHAYVIGMSYEDRPDPFTDYRSGFRVTISKRLSQIDVHYDAQPIRRYTIGYESHPHWSLLTTITQYGADGVSALPPTIFGYSLFEPSVGPAPISALNDVIRSQGEPPEALNSDDIGIIDLNADSLPDILNTESNHTAYLNRGVQMIGNQPVILWTGPIDITSQEGRVQQMQLSSSLMHLADMTGDGVADLVITDTSNRVEYFENSGQNAWLPGQQMSIEQSSPPAPNGTQGESTKTADLGFNKRIDITQSSHGALLSWFNQGDGRYTGPIVTDAPVDGSNPIEFSDTGVFLADMNGDRLLDIAHIKSYSIVWWPHLGYANYGAREEILLPDRSLDDSAGGNLSRARLEDITGDGLSDLVVEQANGSDLWFWQNMGNGQFAPSRVIIDLPVTPNAQPSWADINGNGTTDLIYADASLPNSRIQAVDLGVLIGRSPHFNLLTSIDHSFGRKIDINYRSTTEYMVDAYIAGHPWMTTIPFPAHVVNETRTSIGLDLDGFADEGPDGDIYITKFLYRDGYYDPSEYQFRGFSFVKQIELGDERFGGSSAPTLVKRFGFHTGAPDGIDNNGDGTIDEPGDLWIGREEEPLKGILLWQENTALPDDQANDGVFANDAIVFDRMLTSWTVRDLCHNNGGTMVDLIGDPDYRTADAYNRHVHQSVATQTDHVIIEKRNAPSKLLRNFSDTDALGNVIFDQALGDVSNPDDDLYTAFEYALNVPNWIIDRTCKVIQTDGAPGGAFVSEMRQYYDGIEFVGLPLGQIDSRGVLHRSEKLVSKDAVPLLTARSSAIGDPRDPTGVVDTMRRQVDIYGNPIVFRNANSHDRILQYDSDMNIFPTVEKIVLGGGSNDLVIKASFDYRFGAILNHTDVNGNDVKLNYDTFGRLVSEYLPNDTQPTHTYEYVLGSPVSSITTTANDNFAGMPSVVTTAFFDSMGRQLGTFLHGGPAMRDVTVYNTRGQPRKTFQPFDGVSLTWSAPADTDPAKSYAYDAMGRSIMTTSPPDLNSMYSVSTMEYQPLTVIHFDGEDNIIGPHTNTPNTYIYDGLDRLIEVHQIENVSAIDAGTFVTRYRYALPNQLSEIEDAAGNIKYMRYDGLGRRIFMNDPNRGYTTYTFDANNNVIELLDAMGQQTTYTYDAADRMLSEDYVDGTHPLSMNKSPDVLYQYDIAHPDYPLLENQKGRLSWVDDLTGTQIAGYNIYGEQETVVKRIDQPSGSSRDWISKTLSDNLGRIVSAIYPDGETVQYTYNARGLLATVPNFLDSVSYQASGQKSQSTFANNVITTYSYDPRLRLTNLITQSPTEVFQDLTPVYDQVDNILTTSDSRSVAPTDPRNQSSVYQHDNQYRLITASGSGYGTINYGYDRIGNMASKNSPDIVDIDVTLGTMTSGGTAGSVGRIGRVPGDPPGPHAITQTDNMSSTRTFTYDDNGNMTDNDGDRYIYDFANRLGKVIKNGKDIRYLYDYAGRRVIKRVDGIQTSYINSSSEIRDGLLIKYIFADESRRARVDGAIYSGQSPQVLDLSANWNLISFQVDPGQTSPQSVLASIDGLYSAVYGHDGVDYVEYLPGGASNTLTELLPNHGYWIFMVQPGQLVLQGQINAVNVDIPANTPTLIGVPGLAYHFINNLISQYPDIERLSCFNSQSQSWLVYNSMSPTFANNLQEIKPGQGCWIVSSTPISISPPPPGSVYFYHSDLVGSTNIVTDASGSLVAERYNYPYGQQRHSIDVGGPFSPYYHFTGKERDVESGLHYFGARFYVSYLGRFLTTDPFFAAIPAEAEDSLDRPLSLNLYGYALGLPTRYVDPTGLEPVEYKEGGLVLQGEAKDVEKFKSILKYQGSKSKTFKKAVDDITSDTSNPLYFQVGRDNAFFGDSFATQSVDLNDLEQFGADPDPQNRWVPTQGELTLHFLVEYKEAQNLQREKPTLSFKENFNEAHNKPLAASGEQVQYRQDRRQPGRIIAQSAKQTGEPQSADATFRHSSGHQLKVTIRGGTVVDKEIKRREFRFITLLHEPATSLEDLGLGGIGD